MPLGELSICDASVVMFAALKDQPAKDPKTAMLFSSLQFIKGNIIPSIKS